MKTEISAMGFDQDLAEIIKVACMMRACLLKNLVSDQPTTKSDTRINPEVLGAKDCQLIQLDDYPPEVTAKTCDPVFPPGYLIDPMLFAKAIERLRECIVEFEKKFNNRL